MNPDLPSPPSAGCEAFQQQLSNAADAGTPLTSALQSHLQSCAACRQFAETWFPAAPAALAQPVPVVDHDPLRERILAAAARPEIVPFPVAASRRVGLPAWIGRAAACVVLVGLAYWLLDPRVSPPHEQTVAVVAPTLGQSLAQAEDDTRHEQQVLQTALVDGGQRVQGDVRWTMSALEL